MYDTHTACYCSQMYLNVIFEVHTAVKIKITAFWDVISCSVVESNQCWGGTCHFHLQVWSLQVPIQHTTCHHIPEGRYLNYFYLKCNSILLKKLLEITSIDFVLADQLLFRRSGTIMYWKRNLEYSGKLHQLLIALQVRLWYSWEGSLVVFSFRLVHS
jgi:hypothetical protein